MQVSPRETTMTRMLPLVTAIVMLSTMFVACFATVRGSGVLITNEYDFADFTRLEVGNVFEIEVVP